MSNRCIRRARTKNTTSTDRDNCQHQAELVRVDEVAEMTATVGAQLA